MKTFTKIKKILLFALIIFISHTIIASALTVGGSVTVTVNPPLITGTLTGSPSSCTIASGASSCNVTLVWTATNLDGTLAITSNYPSANTTLAVLSIYSNFSIIAVPYLSSPRILYLYSNATLLAQTTATSSCVANTTWNGSVCAPAPTGTLTVSPTSCTIASGASSCNVNLTWTTTNPVNTSTVTSNYPSANTVLVVVNNWSNWAMAVPYLSSPRIFYLYNNTIPLAANSATSSCAINTTWNGSVCAPNTYTVSTSAGAGGSITPASRTGVIHGSTTTFTVAPNPGYSIGSVLGCSGSLSGNTYTTGPIIAACTVTATFGDSTPPSAPGIVTTSWIGDHYVNTNFVASTTGSTDAGSGIRGYKLCRSYDNGGGCQVWTANGEHAAKSETVSGADLPSPGTYRYYYWYAYDNSGNQSTNSPAEYVRMDAISPVYNSTSFTGCNYESGNNCYVKNGTTFYVNISHTDNESGSNNQYFELSKNGANRGTWDGLTGNIKSYAVPYGVSNGGYYTSYGEGVGMDGAGYLDIQNAQCIQTGNCNVTALGKWPVVAGSGASTMYGVTVYMYDQFYNGVGYTATSKYVYLDNDAPSIPTPTDDGANVASPTLNFYASPSDASSGLSVCYAQIDVNNTDGAGLAMGTTAIGATGNYSWTGLAGNTYYYRYYCTDRVGNSSGWSSWSDGVSINAIPIVATSSVTSITQTTATGGGTVTSNGGAIVTVSGIAWSTSINPTIANSKTTDGWALGGPWSDAISGLTANTTYHVRAYATNSVGTSYGLDVLFTTPMLLAPNVTTSPVTSITQTTATGGGNITSNGGAIVTVSGCAWSTSINPVYDSAQGPISGNIGQVTNGPLAGSYSCSLSGLTANTTYHVRAYAKNSVGTSYGPNDVSFTTIGSTTGTLTASGCTIPENGSNCPSTLIWTNTINPVGVSTIRTPNATGSVVVTPATIAGTTTSTVPYPSRTFVLVNNEVQINPGTVTAIASCNTSINHWDETTGSCVVNTPTNTFTVNNVTTATIFKGKSATLRWNSPLSISCTGTWTNATESGTWRTDGATSNSNGVPVSPLVTTTYTLSCTNKSGTGENTAIVKVVNLNIEEN